MSAAQLSTDGLIRRLVMQRTAADRLRMCSHMFSTAKALALAGITAQGDTTEISDQRRRIFLRFYGNEFTEPQRDVILAAITRFR